MQSPVLLENKTAVLKVQVRKDNLKYPIRLRNEKSLLSKPHPWRRENLRQFGFNTKANFQKKRHADIKILQAQPNAYEQTIFFDWIKLFKIYLITYYHMKTRRLLQSSSPWHGFFNKPVTSLLLPYEKLYN